MEQLDLQIGTMIMMLDDTSRCGRIVAKTLFPSGYLVRTNSGLIFRINKSDYKKKWVTVKEDKK